MLRFMVGLGLSAEGVEYDSITGSVTESVGGWCPFTVSTESVDSGGEAFLTENV